MNKQDPDVAKARADVCAIYREIRKTDHGIARLLYRRTENARKLYEKHLRENIEAYLYRRSDDQIGGLSLLLEN
jgi:hypothetical protein